MINKKIMISLVVGLLAILIIAIVILVLSRSEQSTTIPDNKAGGPTTIIPEAPDLPTSEQPVDQLGNNQGQPPASGQNQANSEDNKWVEHFVSGRVIYISDDKNSQKLLKYIDENKLGEKLGFEIRNTKIQGTNLEELKEFTTICKLTGESLTLLPLAYSREYQKCYVGYYNIISYLNGEVERNKRL